MRGKGGMRGSGEGEKKRKSVRARRRKCRLLFLMAT